MKHYVNLAGRSMLLLALLVCFCSSVWADDGVYHIKLSAAGSEATDENKSFDYTVKEETLASGEKQYTLLACKPVPPYDTSAWGEPIDLTLPNLGQHTIIGDKLFDGYYTFWEDRLASLQFPPSTEAVGSNILLADSRRYRKLKKIDFSKQNISAIKFAEDALYQIDRTENEGALPQDAQVLFNDFYNALAYSICPWTHEMKLVNEPDSFCPNGQMVVLGEKSLGGLTGHLTSLGGVFKGRADKDFSLAIGEGLKLLTGGEFKGSSLVAISLPRSLDLANADVVCNDDVFKDCDKLQTIYAYNGRVPYVIKKGSDGSFKADFDNLDTYDFVPSVYATTDGLTNALFSNRWATLAGDITLQPYVTYATGFTAGLNHCASIGDDPYRSGKQLFAGNKAITSLTVTDYQSSLGTLRIDELATQAFMDCTGLKSVKVVTKYSDASAATGFQLNQNCFNQCTGLTSLTLGRNVSMLSYQCFMGCTSLTDLTLEESNPFATDPLPLMLNTSCFEGCTSLVKADFRNRKIGYQVKVGDTKTTHTTLADRCFYGCSSLTTLLFDNDMETLGKNIADGTKLGMIYFVKRLPDVASTDNFVREDFIWVKDGVTSVDLPDILNSSERVGANFQYRGSNTCNDLTESGDKILLCWVYPGFSASRPYDFSDEKTGGSIGLCDGSTEFRGKLRRVIDLAFNRQCHNITLPRGVTLGNRGIDVDMDMLEKLVCYVDGNGQASSGSNVRVNIEEQASSKDLKMTVTGIYADDECSSVTIPATIDLGHITGTVTAIGSDVLGSSAPKLQKLTVDDSSDGAIQPLSISNNAFANGTALTSVVLPKLRDYSLGANAFHSCTALTSVDLSGCTSIGDCAFSNCQKLASVRLGDKLCFVGGAAFGYTEVKSLVFKQPVEGLAYNYGSGATQHVDAFGNADRLKTVVFDMDPTRSNFNDTWKEFKNNMVASIKNHSIYDDNVDVYITADAYDALAKDATNLSDMPLTTWHRAADYRFMATAAADGSALDKGYGTVCVPTPLDPADSYNLKALFKAQLNDGVTAVTLTPVETADVRAGQPYVFSRSNDDASGLVVFAGNGKSAEGTKVNKPLDDNALAGTFTAITAPQGSYVLQTDNMFHIVGSTSIAVAPYRAYLKALPSAEARLSIIEGEPTAIKGVTENADTAADAPMYNLSGQRIAAPVKGQIYIVKGKKAVQR